MKNQGKRRGSSGLTKEQWREQQVEVAWAWGRHRHSEPEGPRGDAKTQWGWLGLLASDSYLFRERWKMGDSQQLACGLYL